MNMNKLILGLALFLSSSLIGQVVTAEKDFVIGKTLRFKSEILDEEREINVYLPMYYEEDTSKNYPVIYLLDGSADEDFIHIAGLVQFASFSWINFIPESIVVGISNVNRERDFTYPSEKGNEFKDMPHGGHSANFIEFIEKELKPLVSKQFRSSEESTLIGQSLGGLLASEIVMQHSSLFDNYIIVSPSLWWDRGSLLLEEPTESLAQKQIYIAVGDEGDFMVEPAQELHDNFQRHSADMIYFHHMIDKNHGDALHEAVYKAFELFN